MSMNRSRTILLTVVLIIAILLSGTIGTEKVFAATSKGGWHLVETKYLPSSNDISILGGSLNRGERSL